MRSSRNLRSPILSTYTQCHVRVSGAHEARKGYPPSGRRAGSRRVINGGGLLKLGDFEKPLICQGLEGLRLDQEIFGAPDIFLFLCQVKIGDICLA